MKPDSNMPFYGNDFLAAVEGHSDGVFRAYVCAIWHYWHNNHCKGLPNDVEYLRKICRRDKDEWPDIYAVVFDNDKFFVFGEDGLWHQKRAEEEWAKSKAKYEGCSIRGKAGATARWRGKKQPVSE
jgi:uncharacterized protein YdaU (DUF1376 family)